MPCPLPVGRAVWKERSPVVSGSPAWPSASSPLCLHLTWPPSSTRLLVFLPPNSFLALPLGFLPPCWLLYFLFLNLQHQSVTALSPCPSASLPFPFNPLENPSRCPAFNTSYEPTSPKSIYLQDSSLAASPWKCLLGVSNLSTVPCAFHFHPKSLQDSPLASVTHSFHLICECRQNPLNTYLHGA